jgi:phosphoribosylglycinamide formyltransferase-1
VGTAVLASGEGTILEAILDAAIDVAVVVTDRGCRADSIAADAGVEAVTVDRRDFGGFGQGFDRQAYTDALVVALQERRVELVCMAGFGTVLSASFFEAFGGRVLNTHPSLLPAFRGWRAVRDAIEAGATTTGCTVHLATEQLDDGPILRQVRVDVEPDDDEARLHERIKAVERELYPATIHAVLAALSRGEEPASIKTTVTEASR